MDEAHSFVQENRFPEEAKLDSVLGAVHKGRRHFPPYSTPTPSCLQTSAFQEPVPIKDAGSKMIKQKYQIFNSKIADVGIPETPSPLDLANVGNLDPPPP